MQNELLQKLSELDRTSLIPLMRRIKVAANTRLLSNGNPGYCLFLESGIATVSIHPPRARGPVPVAIIGKDSMIGLSVVLGATATAFGAMTLTECSAFAIAPAELRSYLQTRAIACAPLLQHAYGRLTQAMHIAACPLHHAIEERLASCLERAHGLLDGRPLPCTHQQLSSLLSVTRPTITLAMRQLEAAGAVRTRRGLVEVRDLAVLSQIACGCYGAAGRPSPPPAARVHETVAVAARGATPVLAETRP